MRLFNPGISRPTAAFTSAAVLLLLLNGCSRIRYYDDVPVSDSDTPYEPDSSSTIDTDLPNGCGNTLSTRLNITEIEVNRTVQYAERGYDNIAVPTRIELDFTPPGDGGGYVAWTDAEDFAVHVTPIGRQRLRSGEDIDVTGNSLGGFVALNEGFALLTRRLDLGDDIAVGEDTDRPVNSVVWVRFQAGQENLATVLTGTLGMDGFADYNNVENFRSQLAWNGEKFAAYFEVRGGAGHPNPTIYRDKLVYIDTAGAASTEWTLFCGTLRDTALIFDSASADAFCMADGFPEPGFNLLQEGGVHSLLSAEKTVQGYTGGSLGGVVKMSDGTYVAAWSSRRWDGLDNNSADEAHDIALLYMTSGFEPIGTVKWITATPDVDEVNLHIAPYGKGRILLSWNAVENFTFHGETCFGDFGGTYFQTFSADGLLALSEPEMLPAPMTWSAEPYVYPNGDLAWAFANPQPDYSGELDPQRSVGIQTIFIAHLKYCDIGTSVL